MRDKLINKMAEAILQVRSDSSEDLAEAALDALLGVLETPADGYINKHDMLYRQLLDLRK